MSAAARSIRVSSASARATITCGSAGRIDVVLATLRLAGAALVVPLMEELFWRSFLARWIDAQNFLSQAPRRLSFKAIGITSVLFALEHRLWFAGLLAGLLYGWVYRRTGSLWVPVIAHAVTNGALGIWVLRTGSWQFW